MPCDDMPLKQQIEPSVRISVSLPWDAALRLRQLAAEGNPTLRAIGILSVQPEGDSVITLKVGGQDIKIKDNLSDVAGGAIEAAGTSSNNAALTVGVNSASGTTQISVVPTFDGPSTSKAAYVQQQQQQQRQQLSMPNDAISGQQQHLQLQQRRNALPHQQQKLMAQQTLPPPQTLPSQYNNNSNVATTPPIFKSPNTVCPMEGKVPLLPSPVGTLNVPTDFPFESMRQARILQGRETAGTATNTGTGTSVVGGLGPPPIPPPNVTLKLLGNQTSPSGEAIATAGMGGVGTSAVSNKSQFIHPPPPYPGLGPSSNSSLNQISSNSSATAVVASACTKVTQGYQHMPTSSATPAAATTAPTTTSTGSNNIAISSPLLVNLLQNDGNVMTSSQLKSPQMSAPTTPQSPIVSMSPSAQIINSSSPMRCSSATPSDFVMAPTGATLDNGNAASNAVVPSSPTGGGQLVMRNIQQQQLLLSPSSNANLYNPGASTHRFQHASALRHQQQQQVHQQRQHQLQGMQPRFMPPQQQQQFLTQQPNDCFSNLNLQQPQQQLRQQQIRGVLPPPTHSHTQQQQQQQRLMSMPLASPQSQQQFMPHGRASPIAHSPASSHHSMHSPLMVNHLPTQSANLLSPPTAPNSPHPHPQQLVQLHQQQHHQQKELSSISNLQNAHLVPVGVGNAQLPLPPPPDYNQAAAAVASNSRWPALSKPMDSVTKSSFQEFTRYQLQYNLQQQQIHSANGSTTQVTTNAAEIVSISGGQRQQQQIQQQQQMLSMPVQQQLGSQQPQPQTNVSTPSNVGHGLNDPLISLSDLDALTTNDLDALLPTLNCDLDSTLSLEDKNELESLLQDAKDLDLDLIEDNLSAVGMDVGDALSTLQETPGCMVEQQQPPQQQQTHQQSQILDVEPYNQQQQQILQHQQQQQRLQLGQLQQLQVQQQQQQRHQLQRQIQQQHQQQQQQVPHRVQQQPLHLQQLPQQQHHTNSQFVQKKLGAQQTHRVSGNVQQKQFIINPHTGDMEPMASDDSDTEAEQETTQLQFRSMSSGLNSSSYAGFNPANDMLLPSNLFSEEDSNSALSGSQQLPAAVSSDQERSRDSIVSNRSATNRSRKTPQQQKVTQANTQNQQKHQFANSCHPMQMQIQQMQQPQIHSTGSSTGSPRSGNSSPLIGAGSTNSPLASGGNNNKKVKPNLLREKLQQGVKERKAKEATTTAAMTPKPKRERAKGNAKAKTTATTAATAIADEKIKLRLKIDKVEMTQALYEQEQQQQQQQHVELNAIMDSNHVQQQHQQLPMQTQLLTLPTTQPQHQSLHQKPQQLIQPQQQQHQPVYSNVQQQQHQQIGQNQQQQQQTGQQHQTVAVGLTEPRVPPLQIRLRGKNSVVVKNTRKDRKKAAPTVVEEEQKVHHLKRTFSDQGGAQQQHQILLMDGATDNKQTKLTPATHVNGLPNTAGVVIQKTTQATPPPPPPLQSTTNAKTTTIVAGKNGLTISAIVEAHKTQAQAQVGQDAQLLAVGSTNVGTTTTTLQIKQQQQQLSKIATSLPSSITLSAITSNVATINNNNNSSNSNSNNNNVIASNNSRLLSNLSLKNPIKTAATITPILGGKPMTKNHKPPPYITAVQQLQLQKQQQQQQQQLAAAVTMLPSATTLKRVEITKQTSNSSADATTLITVTTASTSSTTTATTTTLPPLLGDRKISAAVALSMNSTNLLNNVHELGGSLAVVTSAHPKQHNHVSQQAVSISGTSNTASPTPNASVLANTLRNSPASNGSGTPGHGNNGGGGEDSGIESMDALSEKSPHQQSSSSPIQQQQQQMVNKHAQLASIAATTITQSTTVATPVVTTTSITTSGCPSSKIQQQHADDEIEKALAKMEGDFPDDLENIVASVLKETAAANMGSGNYNLATTNKPHSAKLNGENIDILKDDDFIKKLADNSEAVENKMAATANSDLKTESAMKVKVEKIKQDELPTTLLSIKKELPVVVDEKNRSKVFTSANSESKTEEKLAIAPPNKENEFVKEEKQKSQTESLQPISIEIPAQSDSDSPRIRTRASSRLESPLDALKASPETPQTTTVATPTATATTTTTTSSTVLVRSSSRVSSIPSPRLGGTLTPVHSNNVSNKRRRQESECGSSNDGVVNDATLFVEAISSSKRARISSGGSNYNNNNNTEMIETVVNHMITKKIEIESSDSDEPLIEVAGKVRNSKAQVEDKTPTVTRRNAVPPPQQQQKTIHLNAGPTQLQKTGKAQIATNTNSSSNTASLQSISNVSSTLVASVGNSNTNNNTSLVHATRGATAAAATSSNTSANNNNVVNASSPTDEKIGTRRSVRASAAANKIIFSRSNAAAAAAAAASAAVGEPKGAPGKTAGGGSGVAGLNNSTNATNVIIESVAEARRKTRSAVIGESMLTEGRRRRTSRDYK